MFSVVGPGLVSTSAAFVRSGATIQRVRMTGLPKNGISDPIAGSTQFAKQFVTTVCAEKERSNLPSRVIHAPRWKAASDIYCVR